MALNLPKIVKDTDTPIQLTLSDESGNPIDIGGLSGLIVEVFQKSIPFDKFSLNAQTGFRSINVTDAVNGIFEIYLNAANTATGYVGKSVFYEVKTVSVNANFDSGTEEKSSGPIELAILTSSDLKNETFA